MSTLQALQRAILARPNRIRHLPSDSTYRLLGVALQSVAGGPPRRLVLYSAEGETVERITGELLPRGTLWVRPEGEFDSSRWSVVIDQRE